MLTTLEEHYGYLSDAKRLALFQLGLARVIRPDDLVADVGCGFGVLGLICLHSGAARVWGIDSTDAIEVARETMARAHLATRYSCIRDKSFRVTLPKPVDVIVCDHVGYFGIDYGIINTLGDARRRFLKPGGRVVPNRIRLMLAGVTSSECRAKAEGWAGDSIPAEYHWLREYGINTRHSHMFSPNEIVTEPAILGTIDLNSDSPELFSWKATLQVAHDGVLDGLGGWFACELAEDVWMTNSPLSDERIDRPQIFLAFDAPIAVSAGSSLEVSVTARHDTGLFSWSVLDPRNGRRQKLSTWHSRILSEADLARNTARPLHLTDAGRARGIVCTYIDGTRTAQEIEEAVFRDHPALLPSSEEIRRFVGSTLARFAQ